MPEEDALRNILRQYWGFDTFRPGQLEIIQSILAGRDTLAVLPTGGGKSLCYQLPALALDGVALIVSPLIALMQDQAETLSAMGIPVAVFSGALDRGAINHLLQRAVEREFKMLYVSPERLQSRAFGQVLPRLQVSFIAVDEAHCVSQWGHDFRPQFLEIKTVRAVHRRAPLLALTASATAIVSDDISRQLALRSAAVFRQGIRRPALGYKVAYTENKTLAVADGVSLNFTSGSAILYARTRRQTEEWTKALPAKGISAVGYHAGLSAARREKAQQQWMEGEVTLMVATSAFGMGIDKPDVRRVIHAEPPDSLEAYYQEAGRAGRDGNSAEATLFYNGGDIKNLLRMPAVQFPPESYLRSVYGAVMEYLAIPAGTEPDAFFPFDLPEFCRRFKLKPADVRPAMRLLGQEGLWTVSDAVFNSCTLWFTVDRDAIDALVLRYPGLGVVAVGLLRLYSGLLSHPASLQLSPLARYLRAPVSKVEKAILQLQQMGMLRYEPAPEGQQIYVHHYRVKAEHLVLNRERLLRLRDAATARVAAIVSYLQDSETCRTIQLERYFSEPGGKDCGICDNCQRKAGQPRHYQDLRSAILQQLSVQPSTLTALPALFPEVEKSAVAAETRTLLDEGKIHLKAGLLRLK